MTEGIVRQQYAADEIVVPLAHKERLHRFKPPQLRS
jgi:hypothetical protein